MPHVSIARFRRAIGRLPADRPRDDPKKWYRTQKEHWLGWLKEYHTTGAYGRIPATRRDARYAYNHIVEPRMLLWLIQASGVEAKVVKAAKRAAVSGGTMMARSGAIRREAPWPLIAAALWKSRDAR